MKMFKRILFLMLLAVTINSCSRDEINTPPTVVVLNSKGAYVISEGGFNPGTSKLSFYNKTYSDFSPSNFNPGNLGLLPDGILYENGNLYISEQGNFGAAGKVYKTDTNGTVQMTGSAGINPYSLAIANNKIYLTNGPSNSVTVLDKNTFSNIASIGVGIYPQEILAIGNRVFVCNTSVFNGNTDSTVSVIDALTDNLIATIPVSKTPSSLAEAPDGSLLVGCPGNSSGAVIYKIDPTALIIVNSYSDHIHGLSKDIVSSGSNEILYIGGDIYAEESIVKYNLSTRTAVSIIPKPVSGLNYGLNYDSEENHIYVCVAASDFTSNGKFRVYGYNGTLISDFNISGGISPRRIALKK